MAERGSEMWAAVIDKGESSPPAERHCSNPTGSRTVREATVRPSEAKSKGSEKNLFGVSEVLV